jgi:hypothetical protein
MVFSVVAQSVQNVRAVSRAGKSCQVRHMRPHAESRNTYSMQKAGIRREGGGQSARNMVFVCRKAVAKAVRVTEQWQVVVDRGESRVAWALQKAALSPALLAISAPQTTRPLDTDCSRRIATVTSARSCSHTCARNIAQRILSSSAIGSCG